jgi:hypothetical protein
VEAELARHLSLDLQGDVRREGCFAGWWWGWGAGAIGDRDGAGHVTGSFDVDRAEHLGRDDLVERPRGASDRSERGQRRAEQAGERRPERRRRGSMEALDAGRQGSAGPGRSR